MASKGMSGLMCHGREGLRSGYLKGEWREALKTIMCYDISKARRGKVIDLEVKAWIVVMVCFESVNSKENINFRLEALK